MADQINPVVNNWYKQVHVVARLPIWVTSAHVSVVYLTWAIVLASPKDNLGIIWHTLVDSGHSSSKHQSYETIVRVQLLA